MISAILLASEGLVGVANCYLLTLLGAAAAGSRSRRTIFSADNRRHFLVLVPAHNEEASIAYLLTSLRRLEYSPNRFEVIVIADNCQDHTADIARSQGSTVWERHDPLRRGKGHALAWAMERLQTYRPEAEAVVFVDADCEVSSNLLTAIEARLDAGAAAVQVGYIVSNPRESWASGLRFAAFALMNTVRPLGATTLGLSCGLLGTGMGFPRATLNRFRWHTTVLAEDVEYHMQLVAAGERVVYAPEAAVTSRMPTTLRQSQEQNLRWEGGRWEIVRRWTPRLVVTGLRQRDPVRLNAGLAPLVPPQSLMLAATAGLGLVALRLRSSLGIWLGVANLIGQVCYVFGGLVLVRAPMHVYWSLAMAPILALWKLGIHARILARRGSKGWVRTQRERPQERTTISVFEIA